MRLRSQRPLHLQVDDIRPGEWWTRKEQSEKNGGPRRRRGTRGHKCPSPPHTHKQATLIG
jgi:hypothetical protein